MALRNEPDRPPRGRHRVPRRAATLRHWVMGAAVAVGLILVWIAAVNLTADETTMREPPHRQYSASDPQFRRAMGSLLGPGILEGNSVRELLNGDQIFPAMLEAIRQARGSVTFETYIYWSGDIGKAFADALSERARAGVKVHVLLDWVGSSKMDDALLDEMRAAGVEVQKFHKPQWYALHRLNNRTHRKLLVVDGLIGFTGGVGIAPKWTGGGQDEEHWRDSHFEIRGPAVAQMQATFMDNWMKVQGVALHGDAYFPKTEASGRMGAQMFSSSPSGGSEAMELMYQLAIVAADRSIDLSMAYFVPDEKSLAALVAAARRGVHVRLIVPGPITDSETVRSASRARWGELLRAGAQIWEYQPTMYHCKVMVVDGLMTSVGSTNFDARSFRLNDEANLNVYDEAFARRQTEVFEADLKHARQVSLADWEARPFTERAKEVASSLLASQL